MIAEARKALTESALNGNVQLCVADVRDMPFRNGEFDVALCMNNTLGNIIDSSVETAARARTNALRELRRLLAEDGGTLVLSVYRREALRLEGAYGRLFVLDHGLSRLDSGDLVVRYCAHPSRTETGIPYYSHWFKVEELEQLLERTGFALKRVDVDGSAICVVAKIGH